MKKKPQRVRKPSSRLTPAQIKQLHIHQEEYSDKHIEKMVEYMSEGKTFDEAHELALKFFGK